MAIIRPGSTITGIRGAVGDNVYSRNSAGPYIRSKGEWIQPDTQRQLDERNHLIALNTAWSATLSEADRESWRTYGRQHPTPNRFGALTGSSGISAYLRAASYRYRLDQTIPFHAAPPAGPLHPPIITFTADAALDEITIALPPGNYDPPFNGLRLYIFIGKPTTQGVMYFSSPWRYAATNLFTDAWATTPWTFASPWPIASGQRTWADLLAQHDTEGQISTKYQTRADAP